MSVYMSPTINVFSIYLLFYVCMRACACVFFLAFYEVRTTSEKFGLHAGDIKFNTSNDNRIASCITICIILPFILKHHMQ